MNFICKRCGYESEHKSNLKRHLMKKNACDPLIENISIENLLSDFDKKYNLITYDCNLCGKKFNSRSNKSKHKESCKYQNNEAIIQLQNQITSLSNEVKILKDNSPTVTNNNNTQININNNGVKLRDFGRENMDAVPNSLMSYLFMELRFRDLLSQLHCDPNFPENQNIRIRSVKRNTMEIFRNNKWDIVSFSKGLQELLLHGHKIFKEFYTNDKKRILEEDMDESDLREILSQLQKIADLNKNEIKPLIDDLQMMLEEFKSTGSAIVLA